ncbi:hypothetical protein P153DRAFT_423391 [Dothidotthia symphoricarpi CBS 119687]|uniref:PARP catalytic domain-containing protein n=1 Tax=Dothidotthia symphoricarpi CBS 119687 TaxID=1392245 RepID=A0A6A6ACJ7_9PLEO|nr:uncharacterized protein P153DRAFT_423391 [Dothidotthia symphoricarpi CBS 119687]KAF2128963.1 hypothetical protein P153DRAFT_423391 [Dothidotthia symphoricarpi CBS 119687]
MFNLFTALVIIRPVSKEALDLFEAACWVPYTPENDIYNAVREIYTEKDDVGGRHFTALQHLVRSLDKPSAKSLCEILLQPWLLRGIRNCIGECRAAVQIYIKQNLDWTPLALELHEFCITVRESKTEFWLRGNEDEFDLDVLPSIEEFETVIAIYLAAQTEFSQQSKNQVAKQNNQHDRTNPNEPDAKLDTARHPLEDRIEEHCLHMFEKPGLLDYVSQRTIELMLDVWKLTSGPSIDEDRRSLALHVSKSLGSDHVLLFRCLVEIASPYESIPHDTFCRDALYIMRRIDKERNESIVAFVRLLNRMKTSTRCWKDVLYKWLETDTQSQDLIQRSLLEHTLKSMRASEWLSFMHDIEALFTGFSYPSSATDKYPAILQPRLLSWKTRITRYEGTIKRLEAQVGNDSSAVRHLLSGEEIWSKNLVSILESLQEVEGKPVEALMQKVVEKLSIETKNNWELADSAFNLLNAPHEVEEVCLKMWNAKHGFLDIPGLPDDSESKQRPSSAKRNVISKVASRRPGDSSLPVALNKPSTSDSALDEIPTQKRNIPLSVVEVMLAGYIQNALFDNKGMALIQSIAELLEIETYTSAIPEQKLKEAVAFWGEIERQITEEAERLEALQEALKKKDPKGTSALLEQLGFPADNALDIELLELPAGVIDVVERVSENEVEISFPLPAHTNIQRGAMGIPDAANTLLLRLLLDDSDETATSFCFHYDNDPNLGTLEHLPFNCSKSLKAPNFPICKSVETAYLYQLNRILYRQLKSGHTPIADLHSLIKKSMSELGHLCISCGISHKASNAQLRRSTPCNLLSCARLWYLLPLHVRIPEIKIDPFAVDLLLSAVYAAAMDSKPELLPGCPIRGNELVKSILNSLPSLAMIRDTASPVFFLRSHHKDAELLISWACVQFRGFLATAIGLCKIPNLPHGTHQFVLANASPTVESAFMSTLSKSSPNSSPKSTVLFHGTTLSRLPAILTHGLRTCSGTSLQRTGAAYGNGIYLAEDPAMSFTYSAAALSWKNSKLHNMRMLLGCEAVGNGKSVSPGIHVITDQSAVMVRYVLLFAKGGAPPIAGHMVPAMASGMRGLRMGTM